MKRPNLKGRLSLCAGYVREGSRLADIGTDHGYLPIALCLSGKISRALACDINPMPLCSARENIEKYGLSDRIETRLGNGLSPVGTDEADDIVIAGMGGELISEIIAACPWAKSGEKRFILQPMTRHDELYRWLCANGFSVERQGAVKDDGKYYTVILARYDGGVRGCDDYTAAVGLLEPSGEAERGFLQKTLGQLKKKAIGEPELLPTVERIEGILDEDK